MIVRRLFYVATVSLLLCGAAAAQESEPKTADEYFNRGVERAKKAQLDAAIDDYGKAILLNPGDGRAYYKRGAIKAMKADFDGALADFNKAIALDPNNSGAYYSRGLAHI